MLQCSIGRVCQVLHKMEGLSRHLSRKDLSRELATVDKGWKEQLAAGDTMSRSRQGTSSTKVEAAGVGSNLPNVTSLPVPTQTQTQTQTPGKLKLQHAEAEVQPEQLEVLEPGAQVDCVEVQVAFV